MWRRVILLLALVGPMAVPVAAESPITAVICVPRAELLVRMTGATVAGTGLRDSEVVLEVWTRASGDWTLVQSYANGTACILAMGEAWESVAPPPA